jgi:hypothetical protein
VVYKKKRINEFKQVSLLQKYVFMPKVCHSSESWNPEVVDFKGTGFPIKNFGNDNFRLLQEPQVIKTMLEDR